MCRLGSDGTAENEAHEVSRDRRTRDVVRMMGLDCTTRRYDAVLFSLDGLSIVFRNLNRLHVQADD